MVSWLKCKALVKNLMSTTAADEVPAPTVGGASRDQLPVLPELLWEAVALCLSAADVVVPTPDILICMPHELLVAEVQLTGVLFDEGLGCWSFGCWGLRRCLLGGRLLGRCFGHSSLCCSQSPRWAWHARTHRACSRTLGLLVQRSSCHRTPVTRSAGSLSCRRTWHC